MEPLTIFIIVIVVTIILFSSFNVSYSSDTQISNSKNNKSKLPSKLNNKPSTKNNVNNALDIGKYNPKASNYALYNLPEKDQYMTPDLKNQIDALRTQYYYDNCANSRFQQ